MTANTVATHWPLPLWIAHRGAGKLAPENTLAAFREGARLGWRAFECDVKLASDGTPFLLHDATLDRTTNGQGAAGDLTWQHLSQLDAGSWHSRSFAGEPMPTLAAIATYLRRNGFALDLEIKPTPGTDELTGRVVADAVAALWADTSAAQKPVLSSFNPLALQAAQQAQPDLLRALLLDELWPGWWDVAQQLGCAAVITNYVLMDKALIERLHQHGMRALVYTVNDEDIAKRLIAWGIDGVITDRVDGFSPVGAG